MARIDYADPDAAPAEVLEKIRTGRPFIANLYRMLLWSPRIADGWVTMANAARFETTVADRDRELAILLVGHLTGSRYEWHHHSSLARAVGITDEELQAVADWPTLGSWTAEDTTMLRVVGAIAENRAPDEQELQLLCERLGEKTLVELVATVCYYTGLARFLNILDVDIEHGR
jgi:4-carboxymuconolactone decarboxylase